MSEIWFPVTSVPFHHKNPRGKLTHPSQGQELESAGQFTDQTKNSISSKKCEKVLYVMVIYTTDVYSCSHKTIYPGQMERFSFGFKMKIPKGYCAKIYGRLGMTVKHGIHLAGGISMID